MIASSKQLRPSAWKGAATDESINRLMAAAFATKKKQTTRGPTLAQNEQVDGHAARTSDEADRDVVRARHARQVQ